MRSDRRRSLKRRVSRAVETRLANRVVRTLLARARQRELGRGRLGYKLDGVLLRAVATDLMTIRVDLET